MTRHLCVVLLGTLAALPLAANSMELSTSEQGRTIGVTCNGCHGTDGMSKGAAPPLKGIPASHIYTQMRNFKSGARPASIMDRIAKGYSDSEIEAVAVYFSSLK